MALTVKKLYLELNTSTFQVEWRVEINDDVAINHRLAYLTGREGWGV